MLSLLLAVFPLMIWVFQWRDTGIRQGQDSGGYRTCCQGNCRVMSVMHPNEGRTCIIELQHIQSPRDKCLASYLCLIVGWNKDTSVVAEYLLACDRDWRSYDFLMAWVCTMSRVWGSAQRHWRLPRRKESFCNMRDPCVQCTGTGLPAELAPSTSQCEPGVSRVSLVLPGGPGPVRW